jgi:large-conductance mechanosensitive channel
VEQLTVSNINIQLIVNSIGALFAYLALNAIIQQITNKKMRYGNMLNKTVAFSLLAAAIVLIPTTVFAGEQYSEQVTVQEGAAMNSGTNIQRNSNVSTQRQYKGANVNGRYATCRNATSTQEQRSIQDSMQTGSAINSSRNTQNNNNVSTQRQVIVKRSTSCSR